MEETVEQCKAGHMQTSSEICERDMRHLNNGRQHVQCPTPSPLGHLKYTEAVVAEATSAAEAATAAAAETTAAPVAVAAGGHVFAVVVLHRHGSHAVGGAKQPGIRVGSSRRSLEHATAPGRPIACTIRLLLRSQ